MPSPVPPRRRQEERGALTRERILDATLRCLVRHGYARTTTTAVVEAAGVSRGAQLHHFKTRQALLAAAVQHLHARLRERFQKGFAQLLPEADRLGAALSLLWEIYRDPALTAAVELQVAARTDPELRAALLPVDERHHALVHRLARESFPEQAGIEPSGRSECFHAVLDLVLDTYGGLRARWSLHPDDPAIGRSLALVEGIAREALATPGDATFDAATLEAAAPDAGERDA